MSVSSSAAAKEILARRRARRSFSYFVDYIRPDYIWSDFSRSVCKELDQFYEDVKTGKRPILVLGAPPQHGKSELVSRLFPAYVFGRNPNLRFGGLSYSANLAASMNRDVQRIMLGRRYANVFPETKLNEKRVVTIESDAKRNSEEFEIVGKKGYYVGAGVGGPLTGKSLDIGVIDDPIKNSKEALSKIIKDGIWDWYSSTFLTRLSKNSGQIIMATRWALDDLSGEVIKSNDRARVAIYPAINEAGEALVPDLHPLEKLEETKKTLTDYFWSAMYQQKPIPDGGGDFKKEKIELVAAVPSGLRFTRGWDLAATVKKSSDYTASVKLGIDNEGVIWIADAFRFRGSPDEVESRIKQTAHLDGRTTKQSIPKDPGQAGVAQEASMSKKLQGVRFEFSPETGDKRSRAMPIAAQVNAGNVRLAMGKHTEEFLDELEHFPNGTHDDMVDALSRAYNDQLSKSNFSLGNV